MEALRLVIFLLLCPLILAAQSGNCIAIDFEQIPSATPSEGLTINNQFYADFGISFALETGGSPVLAAIGSPITAFSSLYGQDTPEPTQGIGTFFLTDDGLWTAASAPPLIINFDLPVGRVGACILDIDASEFFLIDAYDSNGQIILSDTITGGDIGTGDGLATCWELATNDCTAIASIRCEGQRNDGAAFGLGLDLLSFCYLDTIVNTQISVNHLNTSCGADNGRIVVSTDSNESFQFSLDGLNFQTANTFDDLPSGNYTVHIQHTQGCLDTTLQVQIDTSLSPRIDWIETDSASCNAATGALTVGGSGGTGNLRYSINGVNFQSSPTFTNLSSGIYSVYVQDEENCRVNSNAEIGSPPLPILESLDITSPQCEELDGRLSFTVSGGTDELFASLNGGLPQEVFFFPDLAAGSYHLLISDDLGCSLDTTIVLAPTNCPIYIPNAFSPNYDGINDVFTVYPHPKFLGEFVVLRIFDRWGDLLYEAAGDAILDDGWDGTFRGKALNPGVYVYLLEVNILDGKKEIFSGDVTLLR